ncbi:MAG: hypothetical protein AB7P33_08570 [Dehalococcoidia bacterium]
MLNLRPTEIPAAPYDLAPGEKIVDSCPAMLWMDGVDFGSWGAAYLTPVRVHWMPANPDRGVFTAPGDILLSDLRQVKFEHLGSMFVSHYGVRLVTEDHEVTIGEMAKHQAREWITYIQTNAPSLTSPDTTKSQRRFRRVALRRSAPLYMILALLVLARALRVFGTEFSPTDVLLGGIAAVAVLAACLVYVTRPE